MKIALLTDGIYPFVVGGMQKHSYMLCKYLSQRGIHVYLFHPKICSLENLLSSFTDEEQKNITCVFIDLPKVHSFPGHYIYQGYLYSRLIATHVNVLHEVDFIYAKGRCSLYLLKHKKLFKTPIGSNNHGYEFFQKQVDVKSFLQSIMLRMAFGYINTKADYVFSYGGKITQLLINSGVPAAKIIEIQGAVSSELITNHQIQTTGIRKFIFIGRYEKRKGIQYLNTCIDTLSQEYDFEFHFIGNIPESMQLKNRNIKYHGLIKDVSQIQNIVNQSHILVCPSYSEGMPNVILEAMAGGCAVIASDVGAVSLVVDNSVGWLIKPRSTKSLHIALVEAIKYDNDKLSALRTNARSVIKSQFTWDNVIETTINKIRTASLGNN